MASQALKPTNACELEQKLESFHTSSFGWALACCGWNREDAEEVLQASYLKAMEGRARFNGHSSTRTWFFSVVRMTALERRRYAAVRNLAMGRWRRTVPQALPAPTPEGLTGLAERHELLRTTLVRLSRRQREVRCVGGCGRTGVGGLRGRRRGSLTEEQRVETDDHAHGRQRGSDALPAEQLAGRRP